MGHSADIFVTINIQPMTFFGAYTIHPVYVSNMDPPLEYDWNILTRVQSEIHKDFNYLYNEASKAR